MTGRHLAISLSLLAGSCAAGEDSKSKSPPKATPVLAPVAKVISDAAPAAVEPRAASIAASIASVELSQDCPDPAADRPAAGASNGATRRSDRSRLARSLVQPCSQSSLTLAFTGVGTEPAKVELKAVRLLDDKGEVVATLVSRMPTIWKKDGYRPWDGVLSAEASQTASYKLSVPDWAALETKTGKSSHGMMFVVEVDVDIAGTVSTIKSSQFERAHPQNIRT